MACSGNQEAVMVSLGSSPAAAELEGNLAKGSSSPFLPPLAASPELPSSKYPRPFENRHLG